MKVSIITITFNSASTLEDTLRSVAEQNYPNIEYIVVDGLSRDETLDIVNRYSSVVSKVVSEKDKGIYDAMNKGVQLATGDIIGILNSDDFYADEKVISDVVATFEKTNADGVYGDLVYVDRENTGQIVRTWRSGTYREGMFLKGWMPPHPAFFVKRSVYEKFGLYDLRLKSAADYELMLRLIHRYSVPVAYLPRVITHMRSGGQSNLSLRNRIQANREDRLAWEINGLRPGMFTLIRKPLSKIFQFLNRSGK